MRLPGWTALISLLLGKGTPLLQVSATRMTGCLKPKGRTSTENSATKRTEASHRIAKVRMRIGTWNVRTINNGNLEVVKREMARTGVYLLGISEMKWTVMGHFTSDEYEIYYSGQETLKRNGEAFICNNEIRRCILGFNPVDDRIVTIRIQYKPINITVVQIYTKHPAQKKNTVMHFMYNLYWTRYLMAIFCIS